MQWVLWITSVSTFVFQSLMVSIAQWSILLLQGPQVVVLVTRIMVCVLISVYGRAAYVSFIAQLSTGPFAVQLYWYCVSRLASRPP